MKQDIVSDMPGSLELAEPLAQDRISLWRRGVEIPAHKIQTRRKLLPGDVTETLAVLGPLLHLVTKGLVVPVAACYTHNGARLRQQLLTCQSVERRDQGGASQIA